MGMNFSPMYQPVTTKTIKADGDLDLSPYDLTAYDGKFDSVEADEFVGGVGTFSCLPVNVTETNTGVVIATRSINTISATLQLYNVAQTLFNGMAVVNMTQKMEYFKINTPLSDIVTASFACTSTNNQANITLSLYQNDVLLATATRGQTKAVNIDLTQPIKVTGIASGNYSGTCTITFPANTYYLA